MFASWRGARLQERCLLLREVLASKGEDRERDRETEREREREREREERIEREEIQRGTFFDPPKPTTPPNSYHLKMAL